MVSRRPEVAVKQHPGLAGLSRAASGKLIAVLPPYRPLPCSFHFPYRSCGSESKLYYSYEEAGAHIVMLGSYVGEQWAKTRRRKGA